MKSTFKKIIICTVAAALICVCGVAVACTPEPEHEDRDKSSIHMYLIGGQSNASGATLTASSVNEDMTKTFPGFIYYGETEKYWDREGHGQGSQGSLLENPVEPMRAGLGRNQSHIGPEYGMADALSAHYPNAATDDGRKVVIFKSAAGGVAMRNLATGTQNVNYGTWYPRSMRAKLPESQLYAHTGKQYDMFVANFKKVYDSLVEQGESVKIMGMAWMQGESDKGNPAEYKELLKALISDLREDLSEITGQDLSDMRFVAGELSDSQGPSAGSTNADIRASAIAMNKNFNAMLNNLAAENSVDNFKVIASGALPMHTEDGKTLHINHTNGLIVDHDHWAADQAVELGRLFGNALIAE